MAQVEREEALKQMTENGRRQQEPSRTNQEDPRNTFFEKHQHASENYYQNPPIPRPEYIPAAPIV
ncbi:uncharacterized protein G2W53_010187 [Senna tora]|uniref:Uncharacterized protein n=1 Tax=Senna tora TaxID=362788 RepID=A0A834WZH1_9FABA|nr:uncharacterized protein G2W53_010187 [Senna tora]